MPQHPCSGSSSGRKGILPSTKRAGCRWATRPTIGPYGDVEAGFKNAALVLDETFVTPDVSHHCLEPRSAMAYWQNGKLYLHSGTQSTSQTPPAIARWMNMDVNKVVFISEYTGGGFGSKITGGVTMIIPALLSKKLNAPVMMRISREEETIHRAGAAKFPGPDEDRFRQGWPHHGARHVCGREQWRLRCAGRRPFLGPYRLLVVSAARDAVARRFGDDKYAPTECAERARRSAGNCHYRTHPGESRAQARG